VIICDTGPLVAVLNSEDKYHNACRHLLEHERGLLIVPAPVLTEVCYLAATRLGAAAEAALLDALANGELQLEGTTTGDLARMAELVRIYADFPLGAVDASVIAVAERLGATRIATIDHRHFRAVRPRTARPSKSCQDDRSGPSMVYAREMTGRDVEQPAVSIDPALPKSLHRNRTSTNENQSMSRSVRSRRSCGGSRRYSHSPPSPARRSGASAWMVVAAKPAGKPLVDRARLRPVLARS
jgi:uncharacterized protein